MHFGERKDPVKKNIAIGEIILLVCGTTLLALNLVYHGLYSSYEAAFARSRLFDALVWFCFFGTLISLSWLLVSWKNCKVRALLPLIIVLSFTWLSARAPRMAFPPRDLRFFEAHYHEYEDSIKAFTNSRTHALTEGRYALPGKYKHLSEDGKIWVIVEGGRINYFYLYELWSVYRGVAFTTDKDLIFRFSSAGPIKGHPGWHDAEYYRTLFIR